MFKKFAVLLVALFAIGGSVSAFAWWDTLSTQQNETLTIGEGTTLTVDVVATAPVGKVLVPSGVVLKANDVESVVLTYDVYLDNAVATALNLGVTATDVQIGGATTNAGLVNVGISTAASTVNDTAVLVTVTVTLTEPTTEAEYLAIINQDITFTLNFTATE